MNVLDIIYIVAIVVALITGYKTGLLEKLSLTVGIIFGLFNATVLREEASKVIYEATGWDEIVTNIAAFASVLIITIVVIKLLAYVLTHFLNAINLGIINRVAGALLSAYIMAVIVTGVVDISTMIAPDNGITGQTALQESLLYNKIVKGIYKDSLMKLF